MKTITNIIVTHVALLALFGVTALAFAQTNAITATGQQERQEAAQAELEDRQAEREEQKEAIEAQRADNLENRETAAAERTENMEDRQEQAEDRKVEMEERVAERQAVATERKVALQARAQERVTNLAANMSNRIDAVNARIQNIIDRLDSRIEKLSASGLDTSEAERNLTSAQSSVDAAKAAVANIDAEVAAAVSSEDVRSAWPSVKETISTIRGHLQNAQESLRACVTSLKEAAAKTQTENEGTGEVEVTEETSE